MTEQLLGFDDAYNDAYDHPHANRYEVRTTGEGQSERSFFGFNHW